MSVVEKTALQTELQASAIAADIAQNFITVKGRDTAIPDVDELAWDLLFYLQKYRKNNGGLRQHWLKNYGHIDAGGWWCPTLDIINGDRSNWGCFKPNTPRKNKEGKTVKYEHPPKEPTQPFFLELDMSRWTQIATRFLVEWPSPFDIPSTAIPFEFWEWVKTTPELPIIITEGAKKTASLLSANYCAVGLSGVWNGCPAELAGDGTKLAKQLNPQLTAIATPGREIIFAFDNDTKPKTVAAVAKAMNTLAELFEAEGCKTSIMTWRHLDEKGIDDVHAVHGQKSIHEIFENRRSLADHNEQLRKPILKPEQQEYKDKLEAAQRILKENDPEAYAEITSREKVEAKTSTALAPVNEYDPALDPAQNADPEPEEDPTLTYQEIALRTIYGKGYYVAIGGDLFSFNGRYYEKLNPQTEKLKIKGWAGQYWVKDPKTKRKSYRYLNARSINAIWEWALLSFGINPDSVNPSGLNLANGVLKITWKGRSPQWRLHPHTHRDIYLYCSDVEYDPSADPTHCNRLLECLDPAPRTALLRQLSAAFDLSTVRKLHSRGVKAAIAKGTGANGKDSIRAAISKIFANQMTGLGLSEFSSYDNGRKFGLSPLEHSLINWSSENNMGTTLDRVESLNICVTGEEGGIWIERKGKDGYAITPKAIHIFNTNQMPKLKSGMDSLLSRFVVYDFNKTFKHNPNPIRGELQADARFHDDPHFLITEVCPALINRLLQELVNLANEGIDYDSLKSGLEDLQEESTHLWSFVNDTGLEVNPEGRIWVSELWDALQGWYIETGTLEIEEMENGKDKRIWHEQANPYDRNIKGKNQVYKRMKMLFPKIKRDRETQNPEIKGRYFLEGLSFKQSSSLLHNPDTASNTASPTASQDLHYSVPSSLNASEAKNEAVGEGETLTARGSEAVKQNMKKSPNLSTQPEELPEKYRRAGFKFGVASILQQVSSRRYVMVKQLPGVGIQFRAKSYLCEWLEPLSSDPDPVEWIDQSDLREVE